MNLDKATVEETSSPVHLHAINVKNSLFYRRTRRARVTHVNRIQLLTMISLRRVIFEQELYRLDKSLINLSVAFSIISTTAWQLLLCAASSATAAETRVRTGNIYSHLFFSPRRNLIL